MPVSQGTSTEVYRPSATCASISSHDTPASAVTTYSPGGTDMRERARLVGCDPRDDLPRGIRLAGDQFGHGGRDASRGLVLARVFCGLHGTLRAKVHKARDTRLGVVKGWPSVTTATDRQDPRRHRRHR